MKKREQRARQDSGGTGGLSTGGQNVAVESIMAITSVSDGVEVLQKEPAWPRVLDDGIKQTALGLVRKMLRAQRS